MSVGEILERENDRPAYVRFEQRPAKDIEASLREGHYVSKDEDWVLITPPYSKDCVEKKVATWIPQLAANVTSGRIPGRHQEVWLDTYRRWKEGLEPPVDGTSVKDWNAISPAQCENLIRAGCRTIEDLAQCNDEALRRIGMGAHDLKNKAKSWLQAAKDHGPLTMEVAALQKENDTLKASLDALQEQVKLLSMQLDTKSGDSIKPEGLTLNDILPGAEQFVEKLGIEPTPAEQYEAKFGKKPHHLMKDATILKKLQE